MVCPSDAISYVISSTINNSVGESTHRLGSIINTIKEASSILGLIWRRWPWVVYILNILLRIIYNCIRVTSWLNVDWSRRRDGVCSRIDDWRRIIDLSSSSVICVWVLWPSNITLQTWHLLNICRNSYRLHLSPLRVGFSNSRHDSKLVEDTIGHVCANTITCRVFCGPYISGYRDSVVGRILQTSFVTSEEVVVSESNRGATQAVDSQL